MTDMQSPQWLSFFPELRDIHTPEWERLVKNAKKLSFKEGEMLFRDGEACSNYLMVFSGVVRVQKISQDGHEITLYRLRTGQVCEITTTCLLANDFYPAEAIAESPVNAVFVPKQDFQDALLSSSEFRDYVYKNMEDGLNSLLHLLEDVAFGALDIRLAKCLIQSVNMENCVRATHHELAANLGTAREVVSRLLKKFEKNNWVSLCRGKIVILNRPELEKVGRIRH